MTGSEIVTMGLMSLLIFCARVLDVTLGTMRIIFVSKGNKLFAPLLGFCEILIWLLALTTIMSHLTSWVYYVAYCGGFATGNLVGLFVEEKLAFGTLIIRVITRQDSTVLRQRLREGGFGFTVVDAHGAEGEVKIIFMVVKRKDLARVSTIIEECNPRAFVSVEEVRMAQEGIFPAGHRLPSLLYAMNPLRQRHKVK